MSAYDDRMRDAELDARERYATAAEESARGMAKRATAEVRTADALERIAAAFEAWAARSDTGTRE